MDIWNKHKSPLGYFNNSDQLTATSEKYGGFREILKDSMDDLKADALGIIQGNINPSGDCYKIIRKFYSPTIK